MSPASILKIHWEVPLYCCTACFNYSMVCRMGSLWHLRDGSLVWPSRTFGL